MKNILLFCFSVFLVAFANAQNNRFFYEYILFMDESDGKVALSCALLISGYYLFYGKWEQSEIATLTINIDVTAKNDFI